MRRKKRLQDIQEQWRLIDYSVGREESNWKMENRHWKATSMTWSLRKDGWKGWGRSWVDDD